MEIIPKQAPRAPEWLNIVFYFSLAIFVFALIAFFLLSNSLNKANKAMALAEQALVDQSTMEREEMQTNVFQTKDKVDKFAIVFADHLKDSNVFEYFQSLCHPKTWYMQFALDPRKGAISASGETQSFETLGQQLLIYQRDPFVRSVEMPQVSIDKKGMISFSLTLSFDPAIVK